MSKMGELAMEIEEMLFDGATYGEIAARFGLSENQVAEFVEQIESSYEDDGQPTMYEEYQDLYGGDDAFETCSYAEDF